MTDQTFLNGRSVRTVSQASGTLRRALAAVTAAANAAVRSSTSKVFMRTSRSHASDPEPAVPVDEIDEGEQHRRADERSGPPEPRRGARPNARRGLEEGGRDSRHGWLVSWRGPEGRALRKCLCIA